MLKKISTEELVLSLLSKTVVVKPLSHLAAQTWCAHPVALVDKAWLLHPGTAHASQGHHPVLLELGQEPPPQGRVLQGSLIMRM